MRFGAVCRCHEPYGAVLCGLLVCGIGNADVRVLLFD